MIAQRQVRAVAMLLCGLAAWLAFAGWYAPGLVTRMHAGESLPWLNELISGRGKVPLDFYLAKVNYVLIAGMVLQCLITVSILRAPADAPLRVGLPDVWNRYWFRTGPTVYLGIVRIVCVATVLTLLLTKGVQFFVDHSTLPEELYEPLWLNRLLLLPLGQEFQPSATMVRSIYWATVGTGFLALVGWRTNVALAAFALGRAFLVGYKYSFRDFHHPEAAMVIALFILALGPSGRSLSLDAFLASKPERTSDHFGVNRQSMFAWPLLLIQALLALIYLNSGIEKLYVSGFEWMEGTTLAYYVLIHSIERGSELGHLLFERPVLLKVLSVATILFEMTFWLVLVKPRLAWIYVPVGLGFHLGNLVLRIAPFYQFMALYIVFLPILLNRWLIRNSGEQDATDSAPASRTSTTLVPGAATKAVILFDGVCTFCNGWVRFVANRDPSARFQFASLQSSTGRRLLQWHGMDPDQLNTMVLIRKDGIFVKSDAALEILRGLAGIWPVVGTLRFLPARLRNWCYDVFANHRYRWFGKMDACPLPEPSLRARFVDDVTSDIEHFSGTGVGTPQ